MMEKNLNLQPKRMNSSLIILHVNYKSLVYDVVK